jgi:hypothetical protein
VGQSSPGASPDAQHTVQQVLQQWYAGLDVSGLASQIVAAAAKYAIKLNVAKLELHLIISNLFARGAESMLGATSVRQLRQILAKMPTSAASWLKGAARENAVGLAVGVIIDVGLQLYNSRKGSVSREQMMRDMHKTVAVSLGGTVGGFLAYEMGAYLGGLLGSLIAPGPGTFIGVAAGACVGTLLSFCGYWFGSTLAEWVLGWFGGHRPAVMHAED